LLPLPDIKYRGYDEPSANSFQQLDEDSRIRAGRQMDNKILILIYKSLTNPNLEIQIEKIND
jgi:hypothetical protein